MLQPVDIPSPIRIDERGAVRVGESRVLFEVIVNYFRQGESAEDLHEDFPTLPLSLIYATIAYYLSNQAEVDEYLGELEREWEKTKAWIETWSPQAGIRERLVARLRERD